MELLLNHSITDISSVNLGPKKNEMSGTCGTCLRQEKCIQVCWWGNLRERGHLIDVDIDGRILLKWVLTNWSGEAGTGLI